MALNREAVIGNQKSVGGEDAKFRTAQSSRNMKGPQMGMLKIKWIAWFGTWVAVMIELKRNCLLQVTRLQNEGVIFSRLVSP